jgi:hypothetical protein
VSRHDWLLLIHVAGAFCVLAGALLAVVLNQAASSPRNWLQPTTTRATSWPRSS